ncbi:MAG: hypothetical protein KC423_09525 [Anaerolineales bacterium]|nr:hypothetical protein [Anaerolineales bacterium]
MMRFLRSLVANIALLVLAFILALIIWVNAIRDQDPVRTQFLQVPVEIIGQPDNTILQNPTRRQTVQVVFEGPSSVVNGLTDSDFLARVDISTVPLGTDVSVPIVVEAKEVNVTIQTSSPESLIVNLEELVTQEIPVTLDLRGTVARGHSQGTPLIDPPTITVSGPASRVNPLDFARATVFLNNERETKIDSPQPIFYDRQGRVASVSGLTLSTEQVQVTVPIDEAADFAEKFVDVVWTGDPAPGYRLLSISADPPSVLVQGSPTQLGQITRIETEPIDINGLTESFEQKAALVLPTGISLDQDQELMVKIEIEPLVTSATYTRPVELLGLADGLEAIIDPEEVRVFLFGPLPALDTLLDEEVRVTADLFGLDVGTYSLEPDVNFPERGIELRSIQPAQITVTITEAITTTAGITDTASLLLGLPLAQGDGRETAVSPHHLPTTAQPDFFVAIHQPFASLPHPRKIIRLQTI